MAQREPIGEERPTRRFARLIPPPTVRRLSPVRLWWALAGIGGGLVLTCFLVSTIWSGVAAFVHGRQPYQLTFRDIVLDPPPPPWFRGGSAAFLKQVMGTIPVTRSVSYLDLDLERLLLEFRRNAWVEKPLRVERGGANRLTVHLVYREPVAVERLKDGTERTVVDREAVILPRKDVDFDHAGPLIRLSGFQPPTDPARHGEVWSHFESETGLDHPDERVRAAVRIATLLRAGIRSESSGNPAFGHVVVHPFEEADHYVQIGDNLMIHWETGEKLTDAERWAQLLESVRANPPRKGAEVQYLKFSRRGVVLDPGRNLRNQGARPDPG
jgi:hypothetical protein